MMPKGYVLPTGSGREIAHVAPEAEACSLHFPKRIMTETEQQKTPWHLWVVGILAVLWNLMGVYDYLMTETRNEAYLANFTPEQLEYFTSFPAWAVATWAISVWGSLIASVLLLLRKRMARDLFLLVLVTMAITFLYNFVLSNGLEVMGDAISLVFTGLIIVVAVLLYVYARRQAAAGVLT